MDVVREALNSGRAGQVFTRHIFDWQITPVAAALAYLERDFVGVFEREDLAVSPQGEVVHRWLHTRHPHDFHAGEHGLDEQALRGSDVAQPGLSRPAAREHRQAGAPAMGG